MILLWARLASQTNNWPSMALFQCRCHIFFLILFLERKGGESSVNLLWLLNHCSKISLPLHVKFAMESRVFGEWHFLWQTIGLQGITMNSFIKCPNVRSLFQFVFIEHIKIKMMDNSLWNRRTDLMYQLSRWHNLTICCVKCKLWDTD